MKKILITIFAVSFLAILSGCGSVPTTSGQAETLKIVTTIFPEYDWVRQILGDHTENVQLTMLLDEGVDLHSFQPTADDMIAISSCDLFIYVGGESDSWVKDALTNASNSHMQVINLMELLGNRVKEEEIVEGMEHDHEDHDSVDEGTDSHSHETDEHVWLSLKNAKVLCTGIADRLCALDPANAEDYHQNLQSYLKQLDRLDADYQNVVDTSPHQTVLFGDRFPFRYLVDDYGLDYYAAFSGCSAETEASFETVTFLANKADELELNCVLTIENANHTIAQTIVNNTAGKNQQVLVMDSMQAITAQDVQDGASYLEIMEQNLDVLKHALQ